MIVWAVMIFMMSGRDATTSTSDSHGVSAFLAQIFYNDFDSWSDESQEEFLDSIDYPVRKAAHMTEYGILGALIFGSVLPGRRKKKVDEESTKNWKKKKEEKERKRRIASGEQEELRERKAQVESIWLWSYCWISWFFAIVYAITDEIHQYYVPGRSSQFSDVCLDATGAMIGILICLGCVKILRGIERAKEAEEDQRMMKRRSRKKA